MLIRGIEIALHENEDLSNHIRLTGDFFEAEILDYLQDHHKIQKVVLDIGANIGNHTTYFANFLDCGVIMAFEPVPENFELLTRNTRLNMNVICYNTAVSVSSQDNFGMFVNHGNMGASQAHLDGDLRVNSLAIDDLNLDNVSLIKIDVEEHEPAVIAGAEETIQRCRPLILIEDWHREYARLLPDYEIERAWPGHQTFLYRWKDA